MEVLFFLLISSAIVYYVIITRNKFIAYDNSTRRAWSDVANYERQKGKILDSLQPLVENYMGYESQTLKDIIELRQEIQKLNPELSDVNSLQAIEQKTSNLMSTLKVTLENYPELKADRIYLNLMDEIKTQNENVGAGITIFNRNIEQFNNLVDMFPSNIVNNTLLKKHKLNEFKDPSTDKNIDFKPNFD